MEFYDDPLDGTVAATSEKDVELLDEFTATGAYRTSERFSVSTEYVVTASILLQSQNIVVVTF